MHPLHKEVTATHYGLAFGSRTSVDGHILTDKVEITNLSGGLFAFELQVLRHSTYHGTGKNGVTLAHARTVENGGSRHDFIVIANHHVLVDKYEGSNLHVLANLCLGVNVC